MEQGKKANDQNAWELIGQSMVYRAALQKKKYIYTCPQSLVLNVTRIALDVDWMDCELALEMDSINGESSSSPSLNRIMSI